MHLDKTEAAILAGETGTPGLRMALDMVAAAGRMLGARSLTPITSSHIDGCLYHGASGVLYCERLAEQGARVAVPATTNVGALNLLKPEQSRLSPDERKMAFRLMVAHERMGCAPSWTCAPYQAGARPGLGEQIAWGESNAVAFAHTVLGARTNRYGDFLDIACAIAGRAPLVGLHLPENRRGRLVIDISGLMPALVRDDAFYPVLGSMIGHLAGETVAIVDGVPAGASDDQMKAMCAGAASTGAVGLIHVVGVTPEAPTKAAALGGFEPEEVVLITADMVQTARKGLSRAPDGPIDSVALGSPHFSEAECRQVLRLARGTRFQVPVYICLGRHTLSALARDGADQRLAALGVELVVDTCVVVTPILPATPGAMMTNSAKFAHYARGNTGHEPVFGTLQDCIISAQAGHVVRAARVWE